MIERFEYFRYISLLLIGGIIFSLLTGYPQKSFTKDSRDEAVETMSLSADSISANDISGNDISGQANDETLSENELSEDVVSQNDIEELPLEFVTVEDDYFADAAFIGDSRVVSLYMYSGWDADFYCSSGMTLGGVFGEPSRKFKDGNWKVNIATALQENSYKKIYILLGINDMGVGNLDYFTEHYSDMISQIREWQPDAIIYIQSILNVSAARNAQGDYINNNAIRMRNEKLMEMDNGRDIFYLDINSPFCDANGALKAEYTFDGVHIYAKYVPIWTDYLKAHAIVK